LDRLVDAELDANPELEAASGADVELVGDTNLGRSGGRRMEHGRDRRRGASPRVS
jgi:hypothetical protein